MSSENITTESRCPHCGTRIKAGDTKCWLCQEETSIRAGMPEDVARGRELARRIKLPEPHREFGVTAVFGVLAILICLGLAMEAPGVLVVIVVLATPALIRTAMAASKRGEGAPMSGLGIAGIFFSTLGVIVLVGLASFLAFAVACFAVCMVSGIH
jgi:hypothetical protein